MAVVVKPAEGKRLHLRGRSALDVMSGARGSRAVSLRVVELPVQLPGDTLRGPHVHRNFEECMHVLSGEGVTYTDAGSYPLTAGDTILVPAGEAHVTRNTGHEPLVLLCFFPAPDMTVGTEDVAALKTQSA
jgi:mannose-6-phosphate isomerase-like protein (cupin superfamily)